MNTNSISWTNGKKKTTVTTTERFDADGNLIEKTVVTVVEHDTSVPNTTPYTPYPPYRPYWDGGQIVTYNTA